MLQRFDRQFLRDFRDPIEVKAAAIMQPETVEAPPPPPPPTYNEEEFDTAKTASKKLGYAEGFEAGLAQAATEAAAKAQDIAAATAQIAEQVSQLSANYNQLIAQQSAEMSEVILAVSRKVAGEALEARAADAIVAIVNRCLPVLFGKPKVLIELHPDMIDNVREALGPILAQQGFEGDVQYRGNDLIGRHDARVDWGDGLANRSTEVLWREIEALLHHVPLSAQLSTNTTTA